MFVCYWDSYTWNDGKRWPDLKSGTLPSYTKSGIIGKKMAMCDSIPHIAESF